MDVKCESCGTRFKLPDDRVPQNQLISLPCPRCKKKIPIDTRRPAAKPAATAPPAARGGGTLFDEVRGGSYDAAERPFDFIEEGAETALVCESEAGNRATIKKALDAAGYHTTMPESAREVLKQMRFHSFDLVVLNEKFDTPDPNENNVLRYIDRLPVTDRRKIFVALLSERWRTMDNMNAFSRSVNMIINIENMGEFDRILKSGLADHTAAYKVFNEAMKAAGKG